MTFYSSLTLNVRIHAEDEIPACQNFYWNEEKIVSSVTYLIYDEERY